MKVFFTILLLSIVNTQTQYENGDNLAQEDIPDALTNGNAEQLSIPPMPMIDLGIEALNGYWKDLRQQEVTQPMKLQEPGMGNSYIELAKLSKKVLRVSVFYLDPNGDSGNYQQTYTGHFKWLKQFKTLVSTECYHQPPEIIEIPHVEHECKYGIDIAANVVKVALSANVIDIEDVGYDTLAKCVKEKTIKWETTQFHDCFLSTVENTDLARATLAAKISQLKAAGWECDEKNYCKKPQKTLTEEQTKLIGSAYVRGDDVDTTA